MKIPSGEITNLPYLREIGKLDMKIFLSTGMSTIDEIQDCIDVLNLSGTDPENIFVLHCNTAYPTPVIDINLEVLLQFKEVFGPRIGFSDHSLGVDAPIAAVALGARVIEKHFTLDKMQKGPDHPSSIEPFELGELVKGVKAVFKARGCEKKIFAEEKQIINWARESVVTEVEIKAGETISGNMVWVKRPSPGLGVVPAKDLKKVIGMKAVIDIPKDSQVKWEDLTK